MGKGELAHNEQFLLFPQCFLLNQIIVSPLVHIFDIISLFAAELEDPRIGISGKGLRHSFKLTLSQTTNFRPFKLKEFADDNFTFDENDGKFPK